MGNASLAESLETISAEVGPEETHIYIMHGKKPFENLREYRNYYMHASTKIGLLEDGSLGIVMEQVTARRQVSFRTEGISEDQLTELLHNIFEAANYFRSIHRYLVGIVHKDPELGPPLALLGMPPLPDRLRKPGLSPRDDPDLL